ncbi:MAG: hypothetical protein GKR93_14280 [Gammaproteobacteria bacterium]|nr:hypothetical protein [Gammaproteobacteria bacterium]
MERRLKERLIGAAVLVMLAVILIPMVLDDRSETDMKITESNIPARPDDGFNSRIVPLRESELTPVISHMPEELKSDEEVAAAQVTSSTSEPIVVEEEKQQTIKPVEPAKTSDVLMDEKQVDIQKEPALDNNQLAATAWVVQLGSFSSQENATALNLKLREAGYPAFVEPVKRQSGIAYRVRVGPELLRSDARKLAEKLLKNMQIEGIVIRYP